MADGTLLPVAASIGDTINNETVVSGAAPVGQKMAVTKIHTGAHGVDGDSVTQTNPLDVRVGTGVAGQALPTMDAAVRAGFVKPTHGTNVPAVKPASTAAQATDPAMVVAMSPNSPMAQGTPAAVASAWPVEVTDGTNVLGTSAHPLRTDPIGTTTQPISAASLPLPAGAATSAKQPALGTAGTPSVDVLTVQGGVGGTALPVSAAALPLPAGAATDATITARLGTLGQKTMAGSAPVVIASDQAAVPISAASLPLPTGAAQDATLTGGGQVTKIGDGAGHFQPAGDAAARPIFVQLVTGQQSSTGASTSIASSAVDGTILASNANRKGASVYNDSTQVLYLLLANAVSSAAVYTNQIAPGGYYEVPFGYTGVLKGIWAAANGNARVTEFT